MSLLKLNNLGDKVDFPVRCSTPQEIQMVVMTAAAQNHGIEGLEGAIATTVGQGNLQTLTRAHVALGYTLRSVVEKLPLDFWSIDLRGAVQALGEDVTELVLDRIFSRFCIGK